MRFNLRGIIPGHTMIKTVFGDITMTMSIQCLYNADWIIITFAHISVDLIERQQVTSDVNENTKGTDENNHKNDKNDN